MNHLQLFGNFSPISENLRYHLKNKLSVLENVFRPGSDSFYELIRESRELFDRGIIQLSEEDKKLFESTEIGYFVEFEGEMVPLDFPMEISEEELMEEAKYHGKEVDLNKPMRSSGPKKYKVYVRNPKTGNVMVVNFGDVKGGLTAKINDPAARKSFTARHKCHLKKDKTKAGYWACRLPRYKNLVKTSFSGYW